VRAFLAHDDIEPSEEWDEEIIRELNECAVFIVVLSEESKRSQYVNQEIGFALARQVLILPLKYPLNPWCFLSSIQAMELEYKETFTNSGIKRDVNYHDTAIAIVEKLMRREEFHGAIRRALLRGLKVSSNVVETAAKIRLLKTCESFVDEEADEIICAVLKSEKVSDSFAVPALMNRLWHENPRVFDEARTSELLAKRILKPEDLTD
jgi:hypothetical protein